MCRTRTPCKWWCWRTYRWLTHPYSKVSLCVLDGTCICHTQVSCGGLVWSWSSEDPCSLTLQLTSVWKEDYTWIPSPIPNTVSTISLSPVLCPPFPFHPSLPSLFVREVTFENTFCTIDCRVLSRSPREVFYPDRFETTVTPSHTFFHSFSSRKTQVQGWRYPPMYTYSFILLLADLLVPLLFSSIPPSASPQPSLPRSSSPKPSLTSPPWARGSISARYVLTVALLCYSECSLCELSECVLHLFYIFLFFYVCVYLYITLFLLL